MDFLEKGGIQGFFKNPNAMDRLGAIGMALGGLDQGQVVNLSAARNAIAAREAAAPIGMGGGSSVGGSGGGLAEMDAQGLLEGFSPEQKAMLAQMPRSAALKIIRDRVFKAPDPAVQYRANLQNSGALEGFSPEQQSVILSLPVAEAQKIVSSKMFAEPTEPVKGVNVGGNLVNPIDGSLIYEGTPDEGHRILSADETASMGLPAGSYQVAPDGKVSAIGGSSGPTINVGNQSGGGQVLSVDEKNGTAVISDPTAPDGMRIVALPGGKADQGAQTENAQASMMLKTIESLMADPGLDAITGKSGVLLGNGESKLSRLALAANPEAAGALSKHKQLSGQVFLNAFESLKGAGQITEVEGLKAQQARARLETTQSAEGYREALAELAAIVKKGQSRPAGWAQSPENAAQAPATKRLVFDPATGGFK